MEKYIYIGLTLVFTAYGQLAVKSRALVLGPLYGSADKVKYVTAMFTDPLVLSGLALAVAASVTWILAIEKAEIGFAYPFMALSFVLVPLSAAFLFGEKITFVQMIGLLLIVGGVGINALFK